MIGRDIAVALLASVALMSCATPSKPTRLADLDWIGGCWESHDNGTSHIERWMPARDGMRMGSGFVVRAGQPEGRAATPFRLTSHGPNWARFENPTHDYPKTIRYQREGDRLRAWTGDGVSEKLVLDVRLSGCD